MASVHDIKVTESVFGQLSKDDPNADHVVRKFTLSNANGMEVSLISYGASITSIRVPDGDGNLKDVILSFDDIQNSQFRSSGGVGSAAGRVASFITNGTFRLNGQDFNLNKNHRGHHLHGGANGFHTKNWKAEVLPGNKLSFKCVSKDGEEGYPGEVKVEATYELTTDNQLIVKFKAVPNKSTPINMTSHGLFNLAGHENADQRLVDHMIQIHADKYTVPDHNGIPHGPISNVVGTDFDFRVARDLNQLLEAFPPGTNGFNVNLCVNGASKSNVRPVARITNNKTRIGLEVLSDQPCVQFYTAQHYPDPAESQSPIIGKNGSKYMKFGFFALETQQYPNAVNVESFPTTIVNEGETYSHHIIYKFSIVE